MHMFFGDAQRRPKLTPSRWNHRDCPPYCAMRIQQWPIMMIDNETSKLIGKRPTHPQQSNFKCGDRDELDAQNARTKKKWSKMARRAMRIPHATIKYNFLGAGLERERPDALPIASSVRRTNGSSPPIDRTR
jgi:hypothetical protein